MARTRAQRQVYADLLERYGRAVADAFFRAIDDIRKAASLQAVTAAIEAGDIEGALDALDIDPAAFNDMLDRIKDAQTAGGNAATEAMPKRGRDGTALQVRFDGRAYAAEAWLRQHSSELISRTTTDMRAAARASLTDNLARGRNPRQAALDIVGRLNRVTGKREGGVLGLSAPQEAYVRSAREELASADPAALRHYLTRTRRDRRFDRTVTKAIREGVAPPKEIAARALTAYERRLLQLRGETIARVETMTALQRGKRQAFEQAIAAGKISEADVRKAWRSAGDLRVRHTHVMLNGDSAGFNEPFRSASGSLMQHPMDQSLGAGPDEIVGCRCDCEYQIDFYANLR
ncbi:phage minor head protein [Brevundimonas sp. NIBR11]|uniref:phage minor head protein n=1 Tax=Brevundimonas sp. NIBR11 TaxID=3015999 RepID=UPI0022F05190|nr:phage minor head protein [Brevundimonas sp. NIBR11]WGM31496.1 hypothetical protein KKHFBJBL_01743 [Brevundimonas sp. NIBR11]